MLFGVCVSCRIRYFVGSYLFVTFSGLMTSVGEERERERERAFLSAIDYS